MSLRTLSVSTFALLAFVAVGTLLTNRAMFAADQPKLDTTPLAIKTAVAFPQLKWANWSPVSDEGVTVPFRPILLTNAQDGSGRTFVASQQGVIYVFDGREHSPTSSHIFLDITERVDYEDKENEEGLLGMAFHPQFAKNGQFFLYYTTKQKPHVSLISRFSLLANDQQTADPESEEVIYEVQQPYWNHNGGTIAFGPDNFLYIAFGDGGSLNDPHRNSQNPLNPFGSILRIDVDKQDAGLRYAIPHDNPFLSDSSKIKALPETYAYGIRNPWRMAFDRETGLLWLADVGKDEREEINLIVKGGNYGWSEREGTLPYHDKQKSKDPKYIDPIFEYDHTVGKSITGGFVYRGKRFPELVGSYIYADYVTGKIWALFVDPVTHKPVANRQIQSEMLPVMSFGEDEAGEVYVLVSSPTGHGLYELLPSE